MPSPPSILDRTKDDSTKQVYRTSTVTGQRTPNAGFGFDEPNKGTDPLSDGQGRAIVRLAGEGGFLDNQFFFSSPDYVETLLINPQTLIANIFSKLAQVSGFNINAAVRFVQIFEIRDGNPIVLPVANAVPNYSIIVPPSTNFSINFGPYGFSSFGDAIAFAVVSSTTGNLYTPSGSNDLWVNAQVIYSTFG